jgi:CRISPR system Cascade subunit CasB
MTTTTDAQKPDVEPPSRQAEEHAWVTALRKLLMETVGGVAGNNRNTAATLAEWRRGLAKEPMTAPGMWKDIVPVAERVGRSEGWRRRVEEAVHHVLSLYAVHQQSRSEPMHVNDGTSLGAACRRLAGGPDEENKGARRRMYAAVTADTPEELTHHLRGLVTLLRGKGIALDYTRLARELARWPYPAARTETRRRWGRDFEARGRSDEAGKDTPTAEARPDNGSQEG